MRYILRNKSVITGKNDVVPLYSFNNFPIFFGCVDQNSKEDVRGEMCWGICKKSGVIQLTKLIPLSLLYQAQHVDGTGQMWRVHNEKFAKYILRYNPKNVIEIGGAQGKLADMVTRNRDISWTIIEPNPLHQGNEKIEIIKDFFKYDSKYTIPCDTIVLSHVLEHAYDPKAFLKAIFHQLKLGDKLIFSYPNLKVWLKNKFTNAINFEHTFFLTDEHVDYLLLQTGFKIIEKSRFQNHSIFYTVEKLEGPQKEPLLINRYEENKQLFFSFIKYHEDLIYRLNKTLDNFDGVIYLFGAHIFSQYLLEFGLNANNILRILDNSKNKIGKRLYGTSLIVEHPSVIKRHKKVGVIVKVGTHRNSVIRQLKNFHKKVTIFE